MTDSPEFVDDLHPSADPLDAIVALADSIMAHVELFRPHVDPKKLRSWAKDIDLKAATLQTVTCAPDPIEPEQETITLL